MNFKGIAPRAPGTHRCRHQPLTQPAEIFPNARFGQTPADQDLASDNHHRPALLKRILVPCDFSPASKAALQRAVWLANQCEARLTILHVVDVSAHNKAEPAAAFMQRLWNEGSARVAQLASTLCGQVDTQTVIEEALTWEAITQRTWDFDLVILGKDRKKASGLFSRRTVKRVLEKAHCPVMVVYDAA